MGSFRFFPLRCALPTGVRCALFAGAIQYDCPLLGRLLLGCMLFMGAGCTLSMRAVLFGCLLLSFFGNIVSVTNIVDLAGGSSFELFSKNCDVYVIYLPSVIL